MEYLKKIRELYPEFRIEVMTHSISLYINKDYPLFNIALVSNNFDKAFEELYKRLIGYKEKYYNID